MAGHSFLARPAQADALRRPVDFVPAKSIVDVVVVGHAELPGVAGVPVRLAGRVVTGEQSTPLTFEALSGRAVYHDPWAGPQPGDPQHIRLARSIDVAPTLLQLANANGGSEYWEYVGEMLADGRALYSTTIATGSATSDASVTARGAPIETCMFGRREPRAGAASPPARRVLRRRPVPAPAAPAANATVRDLVKIRTTNGFQADKQSRAAGMSDADLLDFAAHDDFPTVE